MKLTETKDGTIVKIYVKPNQPKFKITIDGDEIIVFATEEPIKGRVNKEIIKELEQVFHVKVELVSGLTSRQKQLLLTGVKKDKVDLLLNG